ncbi:NADH-quinone oxidoreductase subunit C [Paenibacillus sp. GCM10023248]|uniref:NADH-quinone oxidoreductase subunit C n=1 Tax=Bacillales TaxID=1385 RepID=UPI002379EA86|nr:MULTISPECIES: NADH-quinone oxidoreductase subunit C [Bacillales]MDD9271962.1 NADH-quinone oxidoreductase subunit C [Paenibacillus sp. MAHUQ-63]MDR6883528.1 NADH-quinone oxidoreductase subunit C [Bacillus sp. 3255]
MSEEKKPEEQAEQKPSAEGKNKGSETPLEEAAADVGKLSPEARVSKTPLSPDVQAAVDQAALNQAADPKVQTTSEPSDSPAAELAERAAPAEPAAEREKTAEEKAAERAAARAARLAAKAAAEAGDSAPAEAPPAGASAAGDDEKAAKAQAAAEARAARASARAAKTDPAEPAAPKEPSPNQPLLDRLVAILKEAVGDDAVIESFINERDAHRPYVVIHSSRWPQAAVTLRDHEELRCDYLRNLSGVDQETHLEVAYHLLSLTHKREYCVKVKTDRDQPIIPSVTPVWATANWNEREVYDLLGIDFPGHPNLVRIMMPDDWVGHPLRKDYEPLDPEV